MLKRSSLLLAMLAMMLLVPMAHAAKGDMSITLKGGMGVPISKLSDVPTAADFPTTGAAKIHGLGTKAGFSGGAAFDYMVTDAIAVGADGSYTKADGKDELNTVLKTNAFAGATSAKATGSLIEAGIHLKYMIPIQDSPMSPYLMVGGGFYSFKSKIEITPSPTNLKSPVEATSNKFGGKVGGGIAYKATDKVGVGVEGVFNFFQFDKDELSKKLTPTGGTAPVVDVSSASNIAVRAMVNFSLASSSK